MGFGAWESAVRVLDFGTIKLGFIGLVAWGSKGLIFFLPEGTSLSSSLWTWALWRWSLGFEGFRFFGGFRALGSLGFWGFRNPSCVGEV